MANQATQIFFLEDTFARSDDWRVLQRFEQRNSFNKVAQQDDAYTAPDVQDNTDVPNIFENHHVNDAGEKIECRAVDIQELIKKKQHSRTLRTKKKMKPWGIMIQTDTHGGDVAAAAADDDYIAFVVFACQKTFFIYYVKLCLL